MLHCLAKGQCECLGFHMLHSKLTCEGLCKGPRTNPVTVVRHTEMDGVQAIRGDSFAGTGHTGGTPLFVEPASDSRFAAPWLTREEKVAQAIRPLRQPCLDGLEYPGAANKAGRVLRNIAAKIEDSSIVDGGHGVTPPTHWSSDHIERRLFRGRGDQVETCQHCIQSTRVGGSRWHQKLEQGAL